MQKEEIKGTENKAHVHMEMSIKKLKIFMEFLLPDLKHNKCSYLRFDSMVQLIQGHYNFDTLTIFKDIVGPNRKYLTYGRLKSAYNAFKDNTKGKSIDFKNFFSHLFSTVLKIEGETVGRNIPNAPSGTTEKFKLREAVSNIKLYKSDNVLSGLIIEYDNAVKAKLLSTKYTNFDVAINLNLNAIPLDGKKGGATHSAFRDYVTHIFGSYTGRMECFGFKTSNGKFYHIGDCKKGTPFIIGKYGEKFHGMKIGLKDGISCIKPQFKKGWFSSTVPADDDTYEEAELIDDEEACQKLTGTELEYALYYFDEDDNMFAFNDMAEDNPWGESYDQVVYGMEQEKVPASQFHTDVDYTPVKKKVIQIVKPQKNQKQIQDEEKKRQEQINVQVEEHMKKKKAEEKEIQQKLEKPVNIGEKIPKGVPIYYSQEIPKKGNFTDTHFKSDTTCLYGANNLDKTRPENVDEDEIETWDKIAYGRAKEVFDSDNFQVFLDKIEPGDILQGSLGNCYFLSAIATIAEEEPDLIKDRFLFASRSNEGCYAVYVRVTGVWKLVLIDDTFPVTKNCGHSEFAFTRANGPELWVVLLEKVWAKLCGGYINIIGGMPSEVFNTFTHSYTESVNIKRTGEEVLWTKLLEGEQKNFLMSAGTGQKGQDKGLTPGHAYSLLRAKEVLDHGVKTRLVELRNPWGEGEWSGEWSDNSDKWSQKLKDDMQVSTADDGKFWMNLKDFIVYFEICNICKIHDEFVNTELNLTKKDTEQHLVTSLVVEDDGRCYIQMHQKYKRFILKDGSHPKQVIMNLMLVDKDYNFVDSVWSDNNIECIDISLKKGQYYLLTDINYRFIQDSRKHGYSITCYSEKKCTLEVVKDVDGDQILKKALISYARTKLKAILPAEMKELKREDAKCYKKTVSNPFPGHVYVFDNQTKDLTFDATVRMKDLVNAGIYNFETHGFVEGVDSLSLVVPPNTAEVVYVKFGSTEPKISYLEEKTPSGEYCNMSMKESDEMIEKATWEKGTKAEIDDGCGIFEYTLQHKKGFGIGFENKAKKPYKISVEWELTNLAYSAKRGQSKVEFDLQPGARFYSFLAIMNPSKQSSYEEAIGFDAI